MNTKQVSIIICNYNPDLLKFERTVRAAIRQKEVDFEIIVTDDGSTNDYFDEINTIFEKYNFNNYILSKLMNNKGIVQNCLNGVKKANGEYVFLTSPGDILFDDYVLRDFYRYCKQYHLKIVFGDYLAYSAQGERVHLFRVTQGPSYPELFNQDSKKNAMLEFSCGMSILGAAYFREKEFALESLNAVSGIVKYVEDYSTTLYGLLNDKSISYYQRKIVWYEYGTGISTCEGLRQRVNEDIKKISLYYENMNKYIKYGCLAHYHCKKKWFKYMVFLFHPLISLRRVIIKTKYQVKCTDFTDVDIEALRKILK